MGNVFSNQDSKQYIHKAITQYQKGDLPATLETLKEALASEEVREGGPRSEVVAILHDNTAMVHRIMGNLKDCILFHCHAIEEREKLGQPTSKSYSNVGSLFEQTENLTEALYYQKKALDMEVNGTTQSVLVPPPDDGIAISLDHQDHDSQPIHNVSAIHYHIGNLESRLGDWQAALSSYTKASTIVSNLDLSTKASSSSLAAIYSGMGQVVKTNMGTKESLTHFLKSLSIDEQYHEPQVIADSLSNIGMLYREMGNEYLPESLDYLTRSVEMCPSPNNLEQLAIVQNQSNLLSDATESYISALRLREDDQNPVNDSFDNINKVMLLLETIGLLYKRRGLLKRSMKYLGSAIQAREKFKKHARKGEQTPNLETKLASSYTTLGVMNQTSGKLSEALMLFEKANDIQVLLYKEDQSQPVSLNMAVAATHNNIGLVHQQLGHLDQAMTNFEIAYEIANSNPSEKNGLAMASFINNIGAVHKAAGEFEKAAKCCRDTLEIRKIKAPNSNVLAISHMNTAVLEKESGDLESAMANFSAARKIQEEVAPNSLPLAATLDGLGILHMRTGNLEEAMLCCKDSLLIRERDAPDSLQAATSYTSIGLIYEEMSDCQEANNYYKKALAINLRDAPDSKALEGTNKMMKEFNEAQISSRPA